MALAGPPSHQVDENEGRRSSTWRARIYSSRSWSPRIIVDDDGPGIPPAELERVFDAFVRLETSRSRETGGVGLGLSIARTVARGHGGDVTLANKPEGGLRATLTLPT